MYMSDEEMDKMEYLYSVKNPEYQYMCIGYTYGLDNAGEAKTYRESMDENDIANACDYFKTRHLPTGERQAQYQFLSSIRAQIAEKYDLSPLDAIIKRENMEEDSVRAMEIDQVFADAIADISTSENQLEQ